MTYDTLADAAYQASAAIKINNRLLEEKVRQWVREEIARILDESKP